MDIFVGSIPFKLKEKELRELFEKFGTVSSATIVIDKRTGQNKGYGFVEMPNDSQALKAIASLNGTEIMGRKIVVNRSEGNKDTPGKSKKEAAKNQSAGKDTTTWRRKLYPKKRKENVIDKHSDGPPKKTNKKETKVKLAKNFKVGKRKKR